MSEETSAPQKVKLTAEERKTLGVLKKAQQASVRHATALDALREEFSDLVELLTKRLGTSKAGLAELCGVNRSTLGKLLKGEGTLEPDLVARLHELGETLA